MPHSMTAYAQAVIQTELGEICCEIKSVNHRYLDVAPRIPDELRANETALREAISTKLHRGRIDCFIRIQDNQLKSQEPNQESLSQLNELLEELHQKVPSMQAIRAIDVFRWPGILQAKSVDTDELNKQFLELVNKALDQLVENRLSEGNKMAELIQQRLTSMSQVITEIEELLPEIRQQYQDRLNEKLADILDKLEPSRLEQEMVLFLQKSDVAEELDRLRAHIDEVMSVLNKDEPAGRRLDFLMQELNREANTLGSKSQHQDLTKASVELKVLIEQMREQVQNIE